MTRLDAIRKENEAARSYGRFGIINTARCDELGIKKMKLVEGDNFIAIVPPRDLEQYYAKRLMVHYDVGVNRSSFLCLQSMKKIADPICEERTRLSNDPNADKDVLSELSPSMRYLYFVVDMRNENTILEGLKYMEMASGLDQDIRTKSKNARTGEWVDISHPVSGKNIIINRKGTTKNNTKYNVTQLEDRKPEHGEVIKAYMEAAPEFDEILFFADYKTIKEEFSGLSADRTATSTTQETATRSESQPATTTNSAPQTVTNPKPAKQEEARKVESPTPVEQKQEASAGMSMADKIRAKLAAAKSNG